MWIKNIVTADKSIINDIVNGHNEVDFNKMRNMPNKIIRSSYSEYAAYCGMYTCLMKYGYKKMKEMRSFKFIETKVNSREEAISLFQGMPGFDSRRWYKVGKDRCDNFIELGFEDWYDWSMSNWGCKWNACDTKLTEGTVEFYTKDSGPEVVMSDLFSKHPDANIEWRFECEDGRFELYENITGLVIAKDAGKKDV